MYCLCEISYKVFYFKTFAQCRYVAVFCNLVAQCKFVGAAFGFSTDGRQTVVFEQIVDYLVEVEISDLLYKSVYHTEYFGYDGRIDYFAAEQSQSGKVNNYAVTVDINAENYFFFVS